MTFKKLVISGALSVSIILGSMSLGYAQTINYKVQSGDTFWIISQKHGVPIDRLMQTNNATQSTILYVGQNIAVPTDYGIIHTIQPGDTYWIISQKYKVDIIKLMAYNGANANTILHIGQKITIPNYARGTSTTNSKPYVTYTQYTAQKGDILWDIAIKFKIPFNELLKANNFNESTYLTVGQVIKIPIHNVPVKNTPGEKYGEYLDWWTEAQYVLPVDIKFEVVDFYTGKSFNVKRTTGANHADCETLTFNDTNIMKEIWGGSLSWARRPIIVKYNNRKIAASMSSLPHAGNDGDAGGVHTTWRSENYGAGYNLDWVKGNGINGVFDIHFANSTRHSDGRTDPQHASNIKIAAGK